VAHNSHLALLPELDVYFAHFGVIYFPATGNKLTPANNSLRFFQWRTEGGQGENNDSGAGSLWTTEKSQQYLKHFFDKVHLLPKDLKLEYGSPSFFLPREPPNLGAPLLFGPRS